MKPEIICALDFPNKTKALDFVGRIEGRIKHYKIGSELFTSEGPELLHDLHDMGYEIFLDLKLHDIPNTVASAMRNIVNMGVWMTTIHTLGGSEIMRAAAEAATEEAKSESLRKPIILGVTLLTSMNQNTLATLGMNDKLENYVERLAGLASDSGLDGIVCSVNEAALIRRMIGPDAAIVTPGIRLSGDSHGDQKRVFTPSDAMKAGSSYMVIGRTLTRADDPVKVLEKIYQSMEV